jgi:mRNA-degrading endonuclease RelE of RelBE toxin-antitoxin system
MKVKLTLSINKEVIEKGHQLAKKEQRSLSSIIEELLSIAIEHEIEKKKGIVKELHGLAGSTNENVQWKDLIRDRAYEKYGH